MDLKMRTLIYSNSLTNCTNRSNICINQIDQTGQGSWFYLGLRRCCTKSSSLSTFAFWALCAQFLYGLLLRPFRVVDADMDSCSHVGGLSSKIGLGERYLLVPSCSPSNPTSMQHPCLTEEGLPLSLLSSLGPPPNAY